MLWLKAWGAALLAVGVLDALWLGWLARAVALDPMLIMYDEPFVGQDPITMAVLVVGVQGMFDTSPEGEVVRCLKRHAEALSVRLGANGEPKVPA